MGALDFAQSNEKTQQAISPLKDPFGKQNIEGIHINIYPNRTFGKPMQCRVEFENGHTEGTQRFEGDDLGAMMTEVQAFIDSLK
jgi:hypothetical protein